ncbi:MAG TPA: SusC/RagA family TonB-linked outer membrane protein, partial [Pedobacter sp.]
MKIYAIIMLVTLSNVSAKSFGQNVNLNLKNTSIEKALELIGEQSGYSFLYKKADLPKDKSISVRVVNASVEDALRECLKNQPLTYRVFQQTIVLKRQQASPQAAELVALDVKGTVSDANGEVLPGVGVQIKNTSVRTVTDEKGNYSITAPDGSYSIVFTYIGFATQEVAINDRSTINVTMVEELSKLNEVVVVGYGTQQKKDATGAITSIKARDLNNVNAISIDNMIQGKAAGVQVLQRTAQPGGGLDIVIRGALSPRGSNAPLYVIDGVPLTTTGATMAAKQTAGGDYNIEGADRSPLASLNPNDIASIDILKDASAAAIYGSAAANGVVLITTKRGVEGKPTINFSTSYSTQKMAGVIDGLNAQDFMTMANSARRERWLFDNRYAPYGPTAAPATGFGINYTDAVIASTTESYNHNDAIYRNGNITDNNLSISGGTEKLKYFSSFNFIDQKSLLRTTDFRRLGGRINLDQTFNKWLKLSVSTAYSQLNSTNPSIGGERININSSRQTQAALFFSPRLPLEQADGSLSVNELPKTPNPAAWLYMKDQSLNRRLFVAPNLQFKINPDFTANIVGGYDNTSAGRENYSPTKAKLPEQTQNNYGAFSENESANVSVESYLTYNRQLGSDHRLTVVGGLGYYKASGTQFGLAVFNIPSDAVENYNLGLAAQSDLNSFFSDRFASTKMSQFGRINYVFKDKYYLGLTGRNDGSSGFSPSKKWGFFPAVSAAWSVSEEDFLRDNNVVNSLKLRASYGATGNDSFIANN